MTALTELRRATDLVPANLRAAARKVLMYQELADNPLLVVAATETGGVAAVDAAHETANRDAALEVWRELVGVIDPAEALVLAREIVGDNE
jgi:hypothetical protein